MYFGDEWRSRHRVLVEGDVDDVVGGLQGDEADGEAGSALGVDLKGNKQSNQYRSVRSLKCIVQLEIKSLLVCFNFPIPELGCSSL